MLSIKPLKFSISEKNNDIPTICSQVYWGKPTASSLARKGILNTALLFLEVRVHVFTFKCTSHNYSGTDGAGFYQ